jgi:hypothetical protein
MKSWMIAGGLMLALTGCETTIDSAGGGGGSGGEGGSGEGGGEEGGSTPLGCDTTELTIVVDGVTEHVDTHLELSGVLTELAPGSWQLDTCPPNADCSEDTLHTITVAVPGVEFNLPSGLLVQLTFDDSTSESPHSLLLENLPSWEGLENPIASDSDPWLYVQTDGDGPFEFSTASVAGCQADGDDFDIRKLIVDEVTVLPGESQTVSFGTAYSFQLTNVNVRDLYELPWSEEYTLLRLAP